MKWQVLGENLPTQGNPVTKWVGRALLKLMGWRIQGEFPNHPRVIVALAPHTSAVDFALTVAVLWGLGLRSSFLAKQSLFVFPIGWFMKVCGGIPVDRKSPQGIVGKMAEEFRERSKLVLGITPEGTRNKVREYKKGFAMIAQAANVPVLPAIIHNQSKVVRFEPLIDDVSDPDQVIDQLRGFAEAAN